MSKLRYLEDTDISYSSGFLYFWGCVFIVMTTLIGIFKHENPGNGPKNENMNVKKAYEMLWKTVKLPNIQLMMVILLTAKVCQK